jgi:Pup-like protein
MHQEKRRRVDTMMDEIDHVLENCSEDVQGHSRNGHVIQIESEVSDQTAHSTQTPDSNSSHQEQSLEMSLNPNSCDDNCKWKKKYDKLLSRFHKYEGK